MAPHDPRRLLAQHNTTNSVMIDGVKYVASVHKVQYNLSKHRRHPKASLVDRGANGGMAGNDVRLISTDSAGRKADVSGIDDHEVTNLPISTVAGLVQSDRGPVVVLMHQYAYYGKGPTIHSALQIEHHKNTVDDRPRKVGGKQSIFTLDGYGIPLKFRNGLAYMDMSKPSDLDMENYPTVVLTSDVEWDPSQYDNELDPGDIITKDDYDDNLFNLEGDYVNRYISLLDTFGGDTGVNDLDYSNLRFEVNAQEQTKQELEYQVFRPALAWAPLDVIKRTFAATTQWAQNHFREPFRRHYKSRFPALNVTRRNEPVATDTIFSDTPAILTGDTCAQLFIGRNTMFADIYGMKTDAQFVNAFEDNIRQRGAMDKLISDRAKAETSKKIKDIMRNYHIDDWQSEPHHQHQNFAENQWGSIKNTTNLVMERSGAPENLWLLCTQYVVYTLNRLASANLHYRTPYEALYGHTPDISSLLQFHFYQPVYYASHNPKDKKFPSSTTEKLGRFVGVAESVGDALTYMILTEDSTQLLYRSTVRPVTASSTNFRLSPHGGETFRQPIREYIRSSHTFDGEPCDSKSEFRLTTVEDLIGRSFSWTNKIMVPKKGPPLLERSLKWTMT